MIIMNNAPMENILMILLHGNGKFHMVELVEESAGEKS